jgi:multidrug efflux pump subunit AcrA (membrane-fusion protein)
LGVSDSIRRLYVSEGDVVQSGATLVDFDSGHKIRAPFQGAVISLPFHELENIFPQVPILRIEDLGDLHLEVALEQQGALRVVKDQAVVMTFESMRGVTFSGRVDSMYPNQDQFIVRIRPTKALPAQILPGMTADVVIEVGSRESVTLVPVAGVSNGTVTYKRGSSTKKTPVKLGVVDNEWAELLHGEVKTGDLILVRGSR